VLDDPGEDDADADGGYGYLPDAVRVSLMRQIITRPEYIYAWVRGGVVMLRMLPVVIQVAALISRRPPHFEAALTLCQHFRTLRSKIAKLAAKASLQRPEPFSEAPIEASSFDALGEVSEEKLRQIRAHFGYQLFAAGDFEAALSHLTHAREPVKRILALFPQLLPHGVYNYAVVLVWDTL
jgi:hypothetical protein